MNCKPGDLAIVIRSLAGNEGKIVTVHRFVSELEVEYAPKRKNDREGWLCYGSNLKSIGLKDKVIVESTKCVFPDESLRPLRDNDGEDEILRIAGKPQKVSA